VHQLSSAAVLAADLARHPNGARLADVVDRVLALAPHELAAMTAPAEGPVRERVRGRCPDRPVSHALEGLREGLSAGSSADRQLVLDSALIGSLDDLLAMLLREEPLVTATPEARQVACDAVVAVWAGSHAAPSDVVRLSGPWQAALDPVPPPLPQAPWTAELSDLLEHVHRRRADDWARSAAAHRSLRRERRWAEVMHEASVAAARAGRLHAVARAQLAAARALALSHTGISPIGAALSLTSVVQAVCTSDLLPASTRDALRKAWDAGS
jgi:hypothetical protein